MRKLEVGGCGGWSFSWWIEYARRCPSTWRTLIMSNYNQQSVQLRSKKKKKDYHGIHQLFQQLSSVTAIEIDTVPHNIEGLPSNFPPVLLS